IGLQNIVQRYKIVTNDHVEILQDNKLYTVKLPLISSESFFYYQEDLLTAEIFENAYNKMHNLKEFYVTIWITVIGFPCYYLINNKRNKSNKYFTKVGTKNDKKTNK